MQKPKPKREDNEAVVLLEEDEKKCPGCGSNNVSGEVNSDFSFQCFDCGYVEVSP